MNFANENVMQPREQKLALGVGAVLGLWVLSSLFSSMILQPIRDRKERISDLEGQIDQRTATVDSIDMAKINLTQWKQRCLPPDKGANTTKSPKALNAQRLYLEWLTDLTQLAGFDSVRVTPAAQKIVRSGKGAQSAAVYITIPIQITAEAKFSQLCDFLDHFYRTDLLQRISRLQIRSEHSEGNPVLKLSLEVEGLALVDAAPRRTIFPQTRLLKPLDDTSKDLVVASTESFPKKPPFRIRIGSEFLTVTQTDGNKWTATRSVDRTFAAAHPANRDVELAPFKKGPKLDTEEFRAILAQNVFIKPPPPKQYRLKFGPLAEQSFIRGGEFQYTIPVLDFDPTLGQPEFVLLEGALPGLQLDRGQGKVTWKPEKDQPVGKFPLKFEVRHPSASDGKVTGNLIVTLREPNTPPTTPKPDKQTVYLGREWTLPLIVGDAETAPDKLSLKLADSAPEGLSLDATARTLKWTPPASVKPGDYTVTVNVSDDGIPPQTVPITVTLHLEDDAAEFTYLVGIVSKDGVAQAWLRDRAQDKLTIVKQGDAVKISDVTGTVRQIGKDYILIELESGMQRLQLGRNLRQLRPETVATPLETSKS